MASERQLLIPRTQFNNCQATKSFPTCRLESVISSLLVVLMRVFFKETTCIVPPGSWESSNSQLGGGGGRGRGEGLGKVDIENKIEQVTKIKSDQRLKFSSPQQTMIETKTHKPFFLNTFRLFPVVCFFFVLFWFI